MISFARKSTATSRKVAPRPGKRFREWATSNPRRLTAVVTLPFVVADAVSQWRWTRARGGSVFSRDGTIDYIKARPRRFVLGIVLSLLPEIVGLAIGLAERWRRPQRLHRVRRVACVLLGGTSASVPAGRRSR